MRRKSRKNVGVIGLGIIGSRAAAGLRAAGYHVFVWNRTARPVPNFLGSAADVAVACDVLQIFVADAPALMDVLGAMAEKLTADHTIICSATIGPEATLEAAKFVSQRGAKFLDAPFTGSKLAAERRQLVYYVGGDDATFLPVRPILEATSKTIVRTGKIGDAALVKIVTNQIAAVSIQVLSEALAIVRKAGIPPEVFAAALEHNAARSGTMDLKLPKMLNGDYDPHFSLKHMFKDVQLAIHVANSMNLDTPTAAVTAGVLFGAIKRGWGDLDFASLYRLYSDDPKNAPPAPEPEPLAATPVPDRHKPLAALEAPLVAEEETTENELENVQPSGVKPPPLHLGRPDESSLEADSVAPSSGNGGSVEAQREAAAGASAS